MTLISNFAWYPVPSSSEKWRSKDTLMSPNKEEITLNNNFISRAEINHQVNNFYRNSAESQNVSVSQDAASRTPSSEQQTVSRHCRNLSRCSARMLLNTFMDWMLGKFADQSLYGTFVDNFKGTNLVFRWWFCTSLGGAGGPDNGPRRVAWRDKATVSKGLLEISKGPNRIRLLVLAVNAHSIKYSRWRKEREIHK